MDVSRRLIARPPLQNHICPACWVGGDAAVDEVDGFRGNYLEGKRTGNIFETYGWMVSLCLRCAMCSGWIRHGTDPPLCLGLVSVKWRVDQARALSKGKLSTSSCPACVFVLVSSQRVVLLVCDRRQDEG